MDRSNWTKGLAAICFTLFWVVSGAAPAAAGWYLNSGYMSSSGGYVEAGVVGGKTEMLLSCRQKTSNMGVKVNLSGLPMPGIAVVDDASTHFTLHFDLGGGVHVSVRMKAVYFEPEDTWGGFLDFTPNELNAFGAAKAIIVTRADGKIAKKFSSLGSRKVEQAIRKRCYPNWR